MAYDCTINEFFSELAVRHGPIPLQANVELTTACNNRCIHCYVVQDRQYTPIHLPTPLVMDLLAAAHAEGTLLLGLTGGEALLHPDFTTIYRTAASSGFVVSILTNATLIDEPMADLFAEAAPWRVSISVYGTTEETYTAVTGNPRGYQALLRALALLAERGIPFRLKFAVLRENYQEVDEFIRLADQYEAPYQVDGAITPANDRGMAPLAHRLSPAELAQLEWSVPEVRQGLVGAAQFHSRAEGDQVFQCTAGQNRYFVNAQGRMSVCIEESEQSWPLDPTDVRGSLRHIFYEEFPPFLAQRGLAEECQECELWGLCQRCPAWRLREAGDRGSPVKFFCELAKCRAELLATGEGTVLEPVATVEPEGRE